MCFERQKKVYPKLVPQKGTSSRCVLFIHKLSKHDHGAAEVQTSSWNDKLTYLSTNFNLAPSKKERMLIINRSLNLSLFIVFYFSTKYLIMLGKVADQGPHTNCTSHSLTFPPPIDLQPSFWASVNNRESPSLDNPHILFANITDALQQEYQYFPAL